MAVGEVPNLVNELQQKLQAELDFAFDESGQWLVNDVEQHVGGLTEGEALPARIRVSTDGTRLQVGTHVDDLTGLLALNKLHNPETQTVDEVENFWPSEAQFKTVRDEDYLYMQSDMKPSTEGFEEGMSAIWMGYSVALEAAMNGKTVAEMAAPDRFWSRATRKILNNSYDNGRLVYFREEAEEEPGDYEYDDKGITSDNLADFPLFEYKHWNLPATLTIGERTITVSNLCFGSQRVEHNGDRGMQLSFSEYVRTSSDSSGGYWDTYYIDLLMPAGMEVSTAADLRQVTKVTFSKRIIEKTVSSETNSDTVDVTVAIEEDTLRVHADDGSFSMEACTPRCETCNKPEWKFRWPTTEELKQLDDPFIKSRSDRTGSLARRDFLDSSGFSSRLSRNGFMSGLLCIDDIGAAEAAYLAEHPYGARSAARDLARTILAREGFADLQLESGDLDSINSRWRVFPYIRYPRAGREIIRYARTIDHQEPVTITDDGEVELNLPTREYMDFRS